MEIYTSFLNTRKNENSTHNFKLIINTTDCLQGFYNLEQKGISIITKPHYIPGSLAFEIQTIGTIAILS